MTPRRKETNFVDNQPVRFYKFVALTFLLITIMAFGIIVFMSTKEAVITITTQATPVDANKYIEAGSRGEWVSTIASTTVELSKKFSPTGSKEEPGIASGVVTLVNDGANSQTLIATTRLLTPDNVLFRLRNRVVVPAKGSIEAEVYADQPGARGNIGPVEKFVIPGLREEMQKIVYGKSDKSMTGGIKKIGILSEEDVKKAEQELLADLEKTGKEKLNVGGSSESTAVYKVSEQSIKNDTETGKEVSEFTLTGQATVLAVFYNDETAKNEAQNLLKKQVVNEAEYLTDDFTYSVAFDNYDSTRGIAVLKIFANGKVKLDPNSKQLERTVFFGKTEDEVRRYLLSLDHIQEVDIKFKPMWIHTVPHVADHVSVVVKENE